MKTTTLDKTKINQNVEITHINTSSESVKNALQEIGLFCGEHICKLRQNKSYCGIFCTRGCKIMLRRELAQFVKVQVPSKK